MKHVFLALFALLGYTTVMVYEPEQTGYSQSDVAGMNRLIDRAIAKPAVRLATHRKVWTARQEADAVDALFGRKGIN